MCSEVGHLYKSRPACLTLVWLFSRVDPRVCFEVGGSVELSSTDVAVVRLRTCVNCLVTRQVALVPEGGLTTVALVGFVTVRLPWPLAHGLPLRELRVTAVAQVSVFFTVRIL